MLIMVISLFLSVAIGNVLHAMDDSSMVIRNTSNDLCVTSNKANFKEKRITTLHEMRHLSNKIFNHSSVRNTNGDSFPKQDQFDIPTNIDIPQVLLAYAMKENLITQSEPVWFRRIFCCSSGRKNLFKNKTFKELEKWVKRMLAIYSQEDNQRQDTIRDKFEDSEMLNGTIQHSDGDDSTLTPTYDFRGAKLENDDKFTNLRRMYRRLEEENKLKQEMREFIEKQQKDNANSDKRKERIGLFVAAVAAVLVTYYGSNTC